ncbi:MAG: YdcF family protein [Smithellaceae bacterium]
MRTFKRIMLVLLLAAVFLAAGVFYAPGFLAYSTSYTKADAVIILLGPVFNDREKHARDLIKNGMADYLIIPAYNKAYHVDHGTLKPLPNATDNNNINGKNNPGVPQYYEDTHLELIEAKKTMKSYGLKSAIFVSSPYHMRRIQIMVDKEFDHQSEYYFSPTPYEPSPRNARELKASDWKKVRREYVKILWFMIYHPWT